MEVVKCGLCKEEIEYSQHCRVYIETDKQRPQTRTSKRPHIGRYKLISTATSTEHISFARRLKQLRNKKNKDFIVETDSDNTDSEEEVDKDSEEKEPTSKSKPKRGVEDCNSNTELQVDNSKPEEKSDKELDNSENEGETDKLVGEVNSQSEETIVKHNSEEELDNSKKEEIESETPSLKSNSSKRTNKDKKKNTMSQPQFQNSFEEYLKPILTKGSSIKVSKTKSTDSNSDLESTRKSTGNPTKSSKSGLPEFESYYWLDFQKPKGPESKKLGYQFQNLVTEIKHMKLPSPQWKIKIMVHKQEMISVSFSNKQTPEKIVSVTGKNSTCDISIDNRKLTLLGSPVYIHSIKDLEILLDIVNTLEPDSPLIQYL